MRVIWWLLTVVAVSTISIVLSEQRTLDPVPNISLTLASPLEGGIRDIANPLNDLFNGVIDRGDLVRENQELKETIALLEAQIAEQQDAQKRVLELEAALGVKQSRPDDQLLAANVIAEEPSGLKRAIAIDRGLSDGIDEGMVVLSKSGVLVGTVSRAYQDFAWIRLITDPDSAVNAQVNLAPGQPQSAPTASAGSATPAASPAPTPASEASPPSSVRGVAEGDLRRDIVLDLLPSDSEITEGTLVLTSGLGGNYPRGLLLGSVKALEQRPQSPFTRATVQPAAELSGLDTVLVLISFTPARLTAP
jgi:rod shape-determining protein MreC